MLRKDLSPTLGPTGVGRNLYETVLYRLVQLEYFFLFDHAYIAIKYNLKTGEGILLSCFCLARSISRFLIKDLLLGQVQTIHFYIGEKSSTYIHKLVLIILLSGNNICNVRTYIHTF